MAIFPRMIPLLLFVPTVVLGTPLAGPGMPTTTDGTEQITCFENGSKFVSAQQAQSLTNEFNRLVCQSNPNAPLSLNPFEGITIDADGGTIMFQNTLNQVATPPNCGEVVEDFRKLVDKCFAYGSLGGVLVETAGGGKTLYIIKSP